MSNLTADQQRELSKKKIGTYFGRKFEDAIKVHCLECDLIYWKEYHQEVPCCKCGGELEEYMINASDYDWKRSLEQA